MIEITWGLSREDPSSLARPERQQEPKVVIVLGTPLEGAPEMQAGMKPAPKSAWSS
jgi:hypothetical protein